MNSENGESRRQRSFLDEIQSIRRDADKGREPEFVLSRMGTRRYSIQALVERIVQAFVDEHAGGSAALHDADTEAKRLQLILATADYVLAVESIQISNEDKASILRRVYAELFTYGPLDKLFADETVTTISIDGADKVFVRYGHGDLTALGPQFEDETHLRTIVRRLLLDSGAELSPEIPIIEAGLKVGGRSVCVNVAGPPVTFQIRADIRVHPAQAVTLDAIVTSGMMPAQAGELLKAVALSPHGFVVVGDTESGKTTLLAAMVSLLPASEHENITAVERAGEMALPEAIHRLTVQWPMPDREARTFGDQIGAALAQNPRVLLLDEVRTDEAQAVYPLLAAADAPRQIWSFRGPADSKRLTSALGMLARRSCPPGQMTESEDLVRSMYRRLPFVITVRRRNRGLHLYSISEWQFPFGAEYPDYVELMAMGWEGIELTGKRPAHKLNLPDDFWG